MFPTIPVAGTPPVMSMDLTPFQGPAAPPMPANMSGMGMGMPPPPIDMPPVGMGPMGTVAPPMSPWQRLVQTFQNDRSLQMGLLQMGLSMMQPVPVGQSPLGHAATAIGQGVNTMGSVKEKDRTIQLQDRQMKQTDRRIAADEARVDLEGRRVTDAEKTSDVQRQVELQKIEHNKKLYPKAIEKIDTEIQKMISGGKVDEAQAEYYRERARLYPQEVLADLKRANAAELSAGKPSGAEAIFEETATAMANESAPGKKKGDPDWDKAYNSAKSKLGGAHFGRTAGSTASQTVETYMDSWSKSEAGKKKPAESDADYEKRFNAEKTRFMSSKKLDDYDDKKLKYMSEGLTPQDREARGKEFDRVHGKAPAGEGKKVSKKQIEAEAKQLGIKPQALEKALRDKGVEITP